MKKVRRKGRILEKTLSVYVYAYTYMLCMQTCMFVCMCVYTGGKIAKD